MTTHSACLCGTGLAYQDCCAPFHLGEKFPPTAVALMRSRYTAYALRDAAYLQATWAAEKRPAHIDFSRENSQWLRLEIIETKKGDLKDQKGIVVFKAYFLQAGEEQVMNEISRFIKSQGRWFYLDGVIKSIGKVGVQTNQGLNAPCACGSGKKFKRCCGS